MSGQLCFLSRHGPFNESQDSEVTFDILEEEEDGVGDQTEGTGRVSAKSALLGDPASVVRSRAGNDGSTSSSSGSSSSSDGSYGSRESLAEAQPVPVGKFWLLLGRFYNSTLASVLTLLVVLSASLTLAGVAVFVVGETPYFDKSLKAFQIPNHVTTLRQESFEAAQKDSFEHLEKRSLDSSDLKWLALPPVPLDPPQQAFETKSTHPQASKLGEADPLRGWPLGGQLQEPAEAVAPRRARRAAASPVYRSMKWRVELVYMARGPDPNIFTKERLETIHNVEMSIMRHPNFTDFCSRDRRSYSDPALEPYAYCSPLNSLLTYFYPSEVNGKIVYDSVGNNLADINGTLAHAMTEPTFYWFVDSSMNSSNRRSKFLRSEMWFGTAVKDDLAHKKKMSALYHDFLISYIDLLDQASTDKVRVLYGGPQMFDYEVQETISHDLRLSIPTGLTILVLLLILTSFSVWLTLWGFASILFSFAWAYFVYHVAFGKAALGLLNVFSGFIIFGIGVDDVFVFVNTYVQAEHYRDPVHRMAHTIKMAGVATFFTSFTTAGAFAANIASQIPAINDFGLFMCLIVSFCWLLVVLVMPSALTLWQRYLHCEVSLFRYCARKGDDPATAMATLSQVLDRHERRAVPGGPAAAPPSHGTGSAGERLVGVRPDGLLDDDSDIPMLDLDEEVDAQGLLSDDDVPFILTDDDNYSPQGVSRPHPTTRQAFSIARALQSFLYRYVATPVIKGRIVVVVVYLMILVTSVILVIHIKPAARPPALYKPDTNIQQLLDLAYNVSGKGISCKSCSGFNSPSSGKMPAPSSGPGPVNPLGPLGPLQPPRTPAGPSSPTDPPPVVTKPQTDKGSTGQKPIHTNPPIIPPSTDHQHGVDHTTAAVPKPTCVEANPLCDFGSSCMDDTVIGPSCRCVFNCDNRQDKVCASNGQTYQNLCRLQQESCQLQQVIRAVYPGPCYDPHTKSSGGQSPTKRPAAPDANSPASGYNPCSGGSCGQPADRPILDSKALVYVVFGIDHYERSQVQARHVLAEDEGEVVYDANFDLLNEDTLRGLCKICKNLAGRAELVHPGGAQCFPAEFSSYIGILQMKYPECRDLPVPNLLNGMRSKSMARHHGNKVVWFAMAFESMTFMGKSSFEAYRDFNGWEDAIAEAKSALTAQERQGLETVFQTSKYWQQIFMEIVGVSSAIYGVAFSLLVCVVAVVIFTAHIGILLIAFLTIGGVILVVVSMFYLLGWEMGAVEAVSLSIIVGSSIDYCIHLIEGYLVAGDRVPDCANKSAPQMRRWRTRHSMGTIGVSILGSALTTVASAVPLCFTTVQLFAKFGRIVAMNTVVSIVYTLTACAALLSLAGPARYRWSLRWFVLSVAILAVLVGGLVTGLYLLHKSGVSIPGPSGSPLF